MPKFNKSLIMQKEVSIKITSENECIALSKWADSEGLTWGSGDKFTELSYWGKDTTVVYYDIRCGAWAGTLPKYDQIYEFKDITLKRVSV